MSDVLIFPRAKMLSDEALVQQLIRLQTLPEVSLPSMMITRQKRIDELHAELDQRGYGGLRPARQLQLMNLTTINRAFYETDPMFTCCKENDCLDEYELIAAAVLRRLQRGMVMPAAIDQVLCESFDEDMVSGEQVTAVLHYLAGIR
ncbi:hypothetical protein [Pseudidiomarina sp.]|uniref:hypothetical protein n=1 Tax=Pseudidiomarina sp. TaxID=2081707 RepID=UPI00299E7333|nr:hypothetical protein [Pseudidiomarina sp.]MDX1706945.1 hypothetical protein [Pseudidiomarina sp.]